VREKLGVTREQMELIPSIVPIITRGAGGIESAVEALEGDDSENSINFIKVWKSLRADERRLVKFETIILGAGLTPRQFLETLTGALAQQAGDVSRMLVAAAQPKVLERVVSAATTPKPLLDVAGAPIYKDGNLVMTGWGDLKSQELFLKGSGFLPTPKGSTTIINQTNQTATLNAAPKVDCLPPPSTDAFLLEIQDVISPKQLAGAITTPPVEVIGNVPASEGEYVDVEI
jgi:hypothetical protein